MAATVNEGEVAVSSTVNKGEEKTGTNPMVDEGQEMDLLSPVISYEPGMDDRLEPFTSEGETKYEGKGKNRSESFSHLPTPGQSAPSTAPSTRPVSEVQNDTAPSTAPSTRPVSEAQNNSGPSTAPTTRPLSQAQEGPSTSTAPTTKPASQARTDPEPSMTDSTSSATDEKGDSAVLTAQGDSVSTTGQGNSATPIGPGEPAAIAAQSGSGSIEPQHGLPPRNISVRYDCGCADIYDHTSKKRQQACAQHRLNPKRSELPSPPKVPLSESTNLPGVIPNLSGNLPQAIRYEESPPRQPPVVTSTKGRNFVQASESGPTFLDPFNSDRAIEPTGPPNTLSTTPTQEDVPLKKSTSRSSNPMKSANSPQAHEGASESRTKQPRKLDAVEGQDFASRLPMDEQRTGEEVGTKPKRVELNEEEEILPCDEDYLLFADGEGENPGREGQNPLAPLNSPHHRRGIQPKSILKKRVDTTAEAGQAESGMAYSSDEDLQDRDRSQGAKLFQATIAKFKAGASSGPRQMAGSPLRVERGGKPIPRLVLETPSDQDASSVASEGSGEGPCERAKKYCPKCLVM